MSRYKLHGVFCALLYFKCTKDKGDTESKDCRFHRHGSICCYFILFCDEFITCTPLPMLSQTLIGL